MKVKVIHIAFKPQCSGVYHHHLREMGPNASKNVFKDEVIQVGFSPIILIGRDQMRETEHANESQQLAKFNPRPLITLGY